MKKSLFLVLIIFSSFLLSQQSLKSNLESIIKDKNATIGVSVWNLEKGEKTSVNGDLNLPMMSVFKLHIAMTILDLVDGGTLKLDQKIKFSKSELMQNTWSPMRDKYPNGGDIPLSEMIKYVVAQSDNNTCDILLNKIGGLKTVENYIHKIGVTDFWAVANEKMMHKVDGAIYKNLTTANASNLLLTKLYTESVLKKNSKDFLIKIMEETSTGAKRLKGNLPENTVVAHKTGTSGVDKKGKTAATNDIGVISLPNSEHLVISVFVTDSFENDQTNEKIIADVAKASFDYYNKK